MKEYLQFVECACIAVGCVNSVLQFFISQARGLIRLVGVRERVNMYFDRKECAESDQGLRPRRGEMLGIRGAMQIITGDKKRRSAVRNRKMGGDARQGGRAQARGGRDNGFRPTDARF